MLSIARRLPAGRFVPPACGGLFAPGEPTCHTDAPGWLVRQQHPQGTTVDRLAVPAPGAQVEGPPPASARSPTLLQRSSPHQGCKVPPELLCTPASRRALLAYRPWPPWWCSSGAWPMPRSSMSSIAHAVSATKASCECRLKEDRLPPAAGQLGNPRSTAPPAVPPTTLSLVPSGPFTTRRVTFPLNPGSPGQSPLAQEAPPSRPRAGQAKLITRMPTSRLLPQR